MAGPSSVRWRVFILIASLSFIAYVLRGSISIATPAMIADLELSEIEFGWIVSAFLWSYTICQFPGGIFGDKVGPRKALSIVVVLGGAGLFLTATVPGPAIVSGAVVLGSLMVVRFLNGIVHGPVFPVISLAISRWFPVGGWALPTGLSSSGLTLGYAASAPVVTWMVLNFGWRLSFFMLAPLGLLIGALWWWYARDYPGEHPQANDAEVEMISAGRPDPVTTRINPPGWVRILKDRNIILLTLSYSFSNFIFYSVFTWFPYYLITFRNIDPTTSGYATASQWVAAAVGAALGGWLCDSWCKRVGLRWGGRWPIVIGQLGCAVFLIIGAYHNDPMIAVIMLGLCFFFQQITEGAYWSSSIAIGNQFAGAAGGVINTGANAMGAFNALLVPWFASLFGWSFAVASGGIFTLIAMLLMLLVRADEPIPLD
ncbi:MAG: MFS transporter [Woeseiaceae bacterium]